MCVCVCVCVRVCVCVCVCACLDLAGARGEGVVAGEEAADDARHVGRGERFRVEREPAAPRDEERGVGLLVAEHREGYHGLGVLEAFERAPPPAVRQHYLHLRPGRQVLVLDSRTSASQ